MPKNVKLTGKYVIEKSVKLNDHISVSTLPINPEQADPLSGLDRLSDPDKSFVFASVKQRLKSVPSPLEDIPRMLMTPGTVTRPLNKATKRAIVSNADHVNGAIIVQIESNKIFHFRQVQMDRDGSFIDLGIKYKPNGTTEDAKLEALIPGDYHCGSTDPIVKKAILEVLNKYEPTWLILHDFFDGLSVNHHLDHSIITKAAMGNLNDLTAELLFASNELKQLSNNANKVAVVNSNHDEFLDKWLNEGKYVTDVRNHVIGLELALAKAKGANPMEYGLKKFQTFPEVIFLKCDESFKVSRKQIECGAHGHRGANGSRGNATNLEKCYGDIVYGHSHSPEILRGAWVVGTSTHLQLGYNKGPSSWCQTMCFVYANGARQLINVIKGKYVI